VYECVYVHVHLCGLYMCCFACLLSYPFGVHYYRIRYHIVVLYY